MAICMCAFIGLCLAAFGALFAAVPSHRLDSPVRWLYPKFRGASRGLERLRRDEQLSQYDGELAALNWLLKSEAQTLHRETTRSLSVETTTGEIAAGDLILNERDEGLGSISRFQTELDRKMRDDRVYVGLGIMAAGFVLQAIGICVC